MPTPVFHELDNLQQLIEQHSAALRAEVVLIVQADGRELPVWCIEVGSTDLRAPAIGFFGGVHGMERALYREAALARWFGGPAVKPERQPQGAASYSCARQRLSTARMSARRTGLDR